MAFLKVYDLTPLTRGAAAERRAILSGVEFKVRDLIVAGVGAVLGLFLTLLLWPVFKSSAIVSLLVTIPAALWLVEGRSGRGMQLKNWQSLKNKAINNSGKFFVSGEEFDPLANDLSMIMVRSLPTRPQLARPAIDHDVERLVVDEPPEPKPDPTPSVLSAVDAWDEAGQQKGPPAPGDREEATGLGGVDETW